MERNNFIPEDKIARYDAMGNPVARPGWDRVGKIQPSIINPTVDKQIEEILEKENF